jgi:putative ATP-dependent endonuclease of the OLD family
VVFALLTFIADMKRSQSVIFAMEEPEIALPPHTQRRIAGYVLKQMGQAIVTSHSPYVIEQFESPDIVVLTRGSSATLTGKPLDAQQIEPRMFRTQKRQFAEAILARAVIVVEGATELVVLHAVSAALEKYKSPETTLTSTLPGFQYSMPAPTRKSPGTVQCSLELSRFRGQVNGLIQAAASAAFS